MTVVLSHTRSEGQLYRARPHPRYQAGKRNNRTDQRHRAEFAEPPLPIEGEAAHYDHYVDDDHWEQPGNLFRLMTSAPQQVLFENTARAMGDARQHIEERHVANYRRADPAYGDGVARALGLRVKLSAGAK